MIIAIWVGALVAYLAFRLWYDGLGKPLTPDEIAHFSQLVQDQRRSGLEQPADSCHACASLWKRMTARNSSWST